MNLSVAATNVGTRSADININGKNVVSVTHPYLFTAEARNATMIMGLVEARYLQLQASLKDMEKCMEKLLSTQGEKETDCNRPQTKSLISPNEELALSKIVDSVNCQICDKHGDMKFNTNNIKICLTCFDNFVIVKSILFNVAQCAECAEYLPEQEQSGLGLNLCNKCSNTNYL